MATFSPCAVVSSLLLLLLILLSAPPEPAAAAAAAPGGRRYGSIFSFGDSYADTGNNPVVFRRRSLFDPVARPPYGATFFGRPTGRDSDGRLVIDFWGDAGAVTCKDPSTRVFWDGVHLTEAAYRHIAAGWLSSINGGQREQQGAASLGEEEAEPHH